MDDSDKNSEKRSPEIRENAETHNMYSNLPGHAATFVGLVTLFILFLWIAARTRVYNLQFVEYLEYRVGGPSSAEIKFGFQPGFAGISITLMVVAGLIGIGWLRWSKQFSLARMLAVVLCMGGAATLGAVADRTRQTEGICEVRFPQRPSEQQIQELTEGLNFEKSPRIEFSEITLHANADPGSLRCTVVFPFGMDFERRRRISIEFIKYFESVVEKVAIEQGSTRVLDSNRTTRTDFLPEH